MNVAVSFSINLLEQNKRLLEQYYEIIMFYGKLTHFSVVINVN